MVHEMPLRLNKMDVKGLRRLRAITQLTSASIPQIILQTRIYFYLVNNEDENDAHVNLRVIMLSILLAIIHGLIEVIFIQWRKLQTGLPP